jgi:branched-chain amino acid transport system substrate-binding protein
MKKYLCLGLAAAMAASVTACGSSSSSTTETTAAAAAAETTAAGSEAAAPAADGENFKIGMIGPLTGGAAAYGLGVRNAAELAINEINAAGGINGYQVEYNAQDDEHDPEKSVNAYNTLKDWGVQFVVGSVTSKPCIAVAAETYADNMFQITPSGSAVECIAEDNAFRVCFSDPDQGKASAQYIAENNLATKIGIIYDSSTEYSTGILESFLAEAKEQGLEVVAEEAFTADNATDFSVQINSLKEAGAELMFMPFYYTEASTVLKQCADIDYAPIFFGVDGMDGILSVENFDTSLAEGVMLLTPFSADEDSSVDFVKAYQDAYGEVPNQFAADSYDAIYAIKAAVEHANITPDMDTSDICDAMKVAMTEITIDGLTGTNMTWNATGEPEKAPKAAMIVDGAYVMQ